MHFLKAVSVKAWRIVKRIFKNSPILVSESGYNFIVICSLVWLSLTENNQQLRPLLPKGPGVNKFGQGWRCRFSLAILGIVEEWAIHKIRSQNFPSPSRLCPHILAFHRQKLSVASAFTGSHLIWTYFLDGMYSIGEIHTILSSNITLMDLNFLSLYLPSW